MTSWADSRLRLARAAGTTSSSPTGCTLRRRAPVCRRLMSNRLPTSPLSRSTSSSIAWRNSRVCSGGHSTSPSEQARGGRLDGREGGAQIVAHGRQQGGAQVVGVRRARRRCRPAPAAGASGAWRRGGPRRQQQTPVLPRPAGPRSGSGRGCLPPGRCAPPPFTSGAGGPPATASRHPAVAVAAQQGHGVAPEGVVELLDHRLAGHRRRQPVGQGQQRLGLVLRARRLVPAAGRQLDQAGDAGGAHAKAAR